MSIQYPPGEMQAKVALPAHLFTAAAVSDDLPRLARSAYRGFVKRAFDTAAVVLTAPFWLTVVALLAVLVAMDGGKPFYSQMRVGVNGRLFRMWKLRSMVADADARLEAHLAANPAARAEWDKTQKLKADPRITRLGRLLRKSSLDELPQLINVALGQMSLVGPRPMMPCQRGLYPGLAYFRLRPGITGNWQVSARNESSFADRARYDMIYDREISLRTDLAILRATARVVTHATGY